MASALKERLSAEIKTAMRGGVEQKDRLLVARCLHAAIRKREIDQKVDLDDDGVVGVVQALVKQHHQSIEQFKAGNRADLVAKEEAELAFLQSFLPPELSAEQIDEIVRAAIDAVSATTLKDQGSVMKQLQTPQAKTVDSRRLIQRVRELLGGQTT